MKYLFRGTTSTLTVPETQTENDQRPTTSTIVPETQTNTTETEPIRDVILSSDDSDDDRNGGNEYEGKIQSESER